MFKALFIIVGIAAGYFVSIAGWALYSYTELKGCAKAEIVDWKLVEYSSSRVAIQVFYTFSVEGIKWKGSAIFPKPYYLNVFSAKQALNEKQKLSWSIWYNPKNPSKSFLERNFPYKECFNALISLAIVCYFWVLKDRLVG